jgi:hypothetical protein
MTFVAESKGITVANVKNAQVNGIVIIYLWSLWSLWGALGFFSLLYIQNYSELLIFQVVAMELVQVAIQAVDAIEISFGSVNICIIAASFRSGVYI